MNNSDFININLRKIVRVKKEKIEQILNAHLKHLK